MSDEGNEFYVLDVRTRNTLGRGTLVIGVSNNRKALRVGDVFTVRYEAPQTIEDLLNERPRPAPTNRAEISLTVAAIDSMRRQIEELPPGVTGALTLTGEGMETVTPKCFLMT